MDMDHEMRRAKFAIVALVMFFVCGYFAYHEARYAVFGATVDADVLRVSEQIIRGRRGSRTQKLLVEYRFTDPSGTMRKESDTVPMDFPVAQQGEQLPVQFIAGVPGTSRLSGHSNMVPVYLFAGSVVFLGVVCVRFWRFYKS